MRYFVRQAILLSSMLLLFTAGVLAGEGDTTWIQAQQDVQLDYFNDFDASIVLPGNAVSYRKIILVFTLGKYQCPDGATYCGDWDYLIRNYLMTATDTFELARLVTPYANASYPRTSWSWKQHYYFDVTDFYPVLHGPATIRLSYHNYSGGFTGNIRLAFIEGTPPRAVTGVQRLWHGMLPFGDAAHPIDEYLTPVHTTVPAATRTAAMRFTVTGHGSDNNYCGEFCSKYYRVYQDGELRDQQTIWRDNCGSNNLYPQSGTWIYDRANWCPGDLVNPYVHQLEAPVPGAPMKLGVQFEPYTGSGGASYAVDGTLFFYGAYSYATDASLEAIIAPSDDESHFRANPICGQPIIDISNTGASVIHTLTIAYGIAEQPLQSCTITGLSVRPSYDTMLRLPPATSLLDLPGAVAGRFVATIKQVNGAPDDYSANNTMTTRFVTAPEWPARFAVVLHTNNYATQTSWHVEDMDGHTVAERIPGNARTTYTDEVNELADGCYRLVVEDKGCDGLYFWANTAAGAGYLYVEKQDGSYLPLDNGLPAYPARLSQDFGCGFQQYFHVSTLLSPDALRFTGEMVADSSYLYWETVAEAGTSHFEVEFSTNDTTWETIGNVPAAGHTTAPVAYHYTHVPGSYALVYYYRLKLYYTNGNWKYSPVLQLVPPAGGALQVTAGPVPFNDVLHLRITVAHQQTVVIHLYDMQGRLLYQKNKSVQEGVSTLLLPDIQPIPAGIYILQVTAGAEKVAIKTIRQ